LPRCERRNDPGTEGRGPPLACPDCAAEAPARPSSNRESTSTGMPSRMATMPAFGSGCLRPAKRRRGLFKRGRVEGSAEVIGGCGVGGLKEMRVRLQRHRGIGVAQTAGNRANGDIAAGGEFGCHEMSKAV